MSSTFVQACLRGDASLEDIDDWIDRWHDGTSSESLPVFLGMTENEYSLWVQQPSALKSIVESHQGDTASTTLLPPIVETLANEYVAAPTIGLQEIFDDLESKRTSLDYFGIARRFQTALEALGDLEHPETPLLRAECMAFSFVESSADDDGRPTYFRPEFSATDASGVEREFPPLLAVTVDVLSHWRSRATTTTNPFLKARYSDLVWDFSMPAIGQRPDVTFARIAIDASLASADGEMFRYELHAILRLKRALDLSLSIGDLTRQNATVATMIGYEKRIASDSRPGLWGFSFDSLVLTKSSVNDAVRGQLVSDMEARFARMSTDPRPDVPSLEPAMTRLLSYYRQTKALDDQRRILGTYAKAVELFATQVPPLMASSWLEKVHELLDVNGLKADADRIALQIHDIGPKIAETFKPVGSTVTIPTAAIDDTFKEILNGPIDEVFARFAHIFVVDESTARARLQEVATRDPILGLIARELHDEDGRKIASAGSLEDDLEGRVAIEMGVELQISAPFLHRFLAKFWETHSITAEKILAYFGPSSVFPLRRHYLLRRGLDAYMTGDYHVASCVLLPEIEVGLRRLLHSQRGSIYKRARNGGFNLRNMDEILREPEIAHILTERNTAYLKVLLTDSRGWNLRNNLLHGLIDVENGAQPIAERVLHALILVGSVRLSISDPA